MNFSFFLLLDSSASKYMKKCLREIFTSISKENQSGLTYADFRSIFPLTCVSRKGCRCVNAIAEKCDTDKNRSISRKELFFCVIGQKG